MATDFKAKKKLLASSISSLIIPILGFLLIVFIFAAIFFNLSGRFAFGTDFLNFYTAAQIVKDGKGISLYKEEVQKGYQLRLLKKYQGEDFTFPEGRPVMKYMNPPFVLFLYLSFSTLRYDVAYDSFFILNIVFLLILILLASKCFTKVNKTFLYVASFMFLPTVSTLFMGQPTLILAINTLLLYHYLRENRGFQAGILTSIFLIKPQFLILCPFLYILSKDKRGYVVGFLSMFALLVGISILITGVTPLIHDYFAVLVSGQEYWKFDSQAAKVISLNGFFSFLFGSWLYGFNLIFLNIIGYIAALFIFVKNFRNVKFGHAFTIVVFLALLFSTHTLLHDLVILLPVFFILLNTQTRLFRKVLLILIFFVVTSSSLWLGLIPTIMALLTFPFIILSGFVNDPRPPFGFKNQPKK